MWKLIFVWNISILSTRTPTPLSPPIPDIEYFLLSRRPLRVKLLSCKSFLLLSLSLPSDVSWYTKVKRTGQEGHLKLPYVTTLFPPRTSCINSAFGRMCPGNPRNISHPRPRFLVKVICCTPYGFEKEGGQAERKWFREKPCITEIFTFYQKGFVIDVKKKIGFFLILSLIFPTIQRNFLFN